MSKATYKLNNITIVISTASMHYNIHLIKKVYFGCGVISITSKREELLKKIYEPIILRKLELSINLPRAVLYPRKTALSTGLLAPRTIIDTLVIKLCIGYQRLNGRISRTIQIIEDNAQIQYGYSKSAIEVESNIKCKKNNMEGRDTRKIE